MIKQQRILIFINRFIALCYLGIVVLVGLRAASGETEAIGSMVVIAFLVWQSFGHFRLRTWAPKVTAALIVVVNLLAVPYLLTGYETQLLPPFQDRLIVFLLITFLTLLLLLNYHFCEKQQRTAERGAHPES